MTSQVKNEARSSGQPMLVNPHHLSVAAVPPELPLFRFGLRHLFWFVAVVSMLLAAIVSLHGLTVLALIVAALVVVAHLFSTALGSQLRLHANGAQSHDAAQHFAHLAAARTFAGSPPLAMIRPLPRSPWQARGSTPLPWRTRLVVAAAILGGAAGALVLTATVQHRTSPAGIAIGAISIAVLGGWFAFLMSSFYGIVRHGLKEAMTEPQNDQAGPPIKQ